MGSGSLIVTVVPLSGVEEFCICTQKVSPVDERYWWTMVWLDPGVRAMAWFQSLPTAKTQELFRVVTRLAVGRPEAAFPVPVAPTTPDGSTPSKDSTVIEAARLWDSVAVTDTFVNAAGANARQISAVPRCTLVLRTSVQVKLAPVTLLTTMFVPDAEASVAMKASSNSFPDDVENAAVVMLVDRVDLSVKAKASRTRVPELTVDVAVKVAVRVVPEG
jgi:hypothetical protein